MLVMVRKIAAAISSILFYMYFTVTAFADVQVPICPGGAFSNLCKETPSIGTIVQTIISLLLLAAVLIALVYLIWGGIRWILSGGDKAAVETARNHVIGAIVGLVIAFAAFFILSFVGSVFKLGNLMDIKVPTFFGPATPATP